MRYLSLLFASGLAVVCVGCESAAPPQYTDRSESAPQPPDPEAPPPEKTAEELALEAAGGSEQDRRDSVRERAAAIAAQRNKKDGGAAADGEEMKKAEVGVGVKGKDYGGPGFVTTPVEAYFTTQDRIAFEVQIPNAMKIYKAANNNKGPQSHEEFMDVIIRENGVSLPELKPGEEYLYDAASEQLMVRAPKTDS